MKVYKRTGQCPLNDLCTEGNGGTIKYLIDGKWIQSTKSGWENKALKDKRFFILVGNNFRLK